MLEVLLWTGVGAFSGFLVGTYRCTDISKAAPKFGAGAHITG